ncbi:hypothetical protein [Ignavibacterium sp.]|uniref:hypothetical protein n=1 Tax=Ignavibacterium sp. TaxID=2651167 RepID=UPI00307CCAD9
MELSDILSFIRTNTDWLYVVIYQNKLFFIDYWSFVHFFSGALLPVVLANLKIKRFYLISILILVFYEVLEISLIYLAFNLFRPETIKDQFTDIFIGTIGVFIISSVKNRIDLSEFRGKRNNYFYALISSMIIAFIWVGFYQYKYNIEILNTKGLNIWAFLQWFIGLFSICLLYQKLKSDFFRKEILLSALYAMYLLMLIIVELIGYEILGIKEINHPNSSPLIFDLIHGTKTMHIFYLISPFITILLYKGIKYLFYNFFISNSSAQIRTQSVLFETINQTD